MIGMDVILFATPKEDRIMSKDKEELKHCGKDMVGYQASDYPFDSGYKCVVCDREFSHLQISRGGHHDGG